MKFYIAARFNLMDKIKEVYKLLVEEGHEISLDWTEHKPIKPYDKNINTSKQYSIEDIDGVRNSDVFVLVSDEAGTGMYVELGVAILSNIIYGKPRIFIIGENNTRAMFYFHPSVERRENLEQVLSELDIIKSRKS